MLFYQTLGRIKKKKKKQINLSYIYSNKLSHFLSQLNTKTCRNKCVGISLNRRGTSVAHEIQSFEQYTTRMQNGNAVARYGRSACRYIER